MKKLIALLLVICMVISLSACKKPADNPGGTTGQSAKATEDTKADTPTEGTGKPDAPTEGVGTPEVPGNDEAADPKPFAGKKLQIYGYSSSSYEDLQNMGRGTYIWMVRAAVDEWAYLNDVEVDFVAGYDQSVILGDIHGGGKPDLLLYCNRFPLPALTGITRAFTQEEYDTLAATCGTYYLDMLQYKGQSYGVVSPWSGGNLFYYNKTQFEKYGVKSPAEYFMEDNWNWDTFETCITEITRDEDGDGINELYGSGTTTWLVPEFYYRELGEDGKLTSLMRNSEAFKRYLEIYSTAVKNKTHGKYATAYIATIPKPATSIGDGEWYNFQHMHQVLVNGDVIEVVPVPKYTNASESVYTHTAVYSSILSSCDEPEATLSLLNYVLQAGMRYMADFSLGLYKCEYEGITGASEYSAGWKQRFDAIVAQRQAEFDKLSGWDQTLYEKTIAYILEADIHYVSHDYPKESDGAFIGPIPTTPSVNDLNTIAEREEEWIKKFNEKYVK